MQLGKVLEDVVAALGSEVFLGRDATGAGAAFCTPERSERVLDRVEAVDMLGDALVSIRHKGPSESSSDNQGIAERTFVIPVENFAVFAWHLVDLQLLFSRSRYGRTR